MNKRICDLSDIESLYFFQNSKETEMQEPKSGGFVTDKAFNRLQELKSLLPEDFDSFVILMRDKYPETPIKDIEEGCEERYKVIRKFSLGLIDNLNELIEASKGLTKIPVTGQCVMSSLDFQSQSPQYIKKTDMTYTPKPEDTWKGYCPKPDSSKTQLPKCWSTQDDETFDECARGAKKLCNCGYFKAISIYKPQNLEASTTLKLENSYYQILAECAKEFKFKNELYGDSVFQVRESSLVDKLYAKAKRVITLSKDGVSNKGRVGESIAEDLKAIINYTLIILVLLQKTEGDKCLEYNNMVQKCIEVAEMKDADYGSAWKEYRVETLLDEVFVKVYRLQSLIASKPKGYEDNYFDLINYAIFSLIKLR